MNTVCNSPIHAVPIFKFKCPFPSHTPAPLSHSLTVVWKSEKRDKKTQMCTPWTMTRFVRWRVRDWTSCFLASRFPLDQEPDTYCSSSPQLPMRNMVFDMNEDTRGNKTNKKSPRRSKCNTERRLNHDQTQATSTVSGENGTEDSSCRPHFTDEEYIVFCFREDGAFDVVKDCKSDASNHLDHTRSSSSSLVNRKLNYGDYVETVSNHSHGKRLDEDGIDINPKNERDCFVPDKEGEEEKSIYFDAQSPSSSITRRHQIEQTEEHGGMVSVESSDSNHSDTSNGSFAFPVLGWEWMGSPVQMPKSERLHLRKHKARCVRFQCCRF